MYFYFIENTLLLPQEYVPGMVSEEVFPPKEDVQPAIVQQQSGLLEGSEESGTQYMATEGQYRYPSLHGHKE